MLNKCPKCNGEIRVHVSITMCCDPNGVPQNSAQLAHGLASGLARYSGVDESKESVAHCINPDCKWQKNVRIVGPNHPEHPKRMPMHTLN